MWFSKEEKEEGKRHSQNIYNFLKEREKKRRSHRLFIQVIAKKDFRRKAETEYRINLSFVSAKRKRRLVNESDWFPPVKQTES